MRNIHAFSVLQNSFLKAKSGRLARLLLDAVGNIYSADRANYFILEAQHTLSQFAERVPRLPEVQTRYFEVLEFVVLVLNHVPCKELFSISVLLKSSTSYVCSTTAARTLLKLARHHAVFSDVYREVGLLEVLVNLLHKYAALLKEPTPAHGEQGNVFAFGFVFQRQLNLVSHSRVARLQFALAKICNTGHKTEQSTHPTIHPSLPPQ